MYIIFDLINVSRDSMIYLILTFTLMCRLLVLLPLLELEKGHLWGVLWNISEQFWPIWMQIL